MRCPPLSELPPPPPGETGWPWTEESPQLPDAMPDGCSWPRVSIVTPSYNQGRYIERTIRSVLLQGYPDLEYIIIDGGSTDNSVEIIEKYAPWLAYYVSEADTGQSHAINKGFRQATGEIMAYLNSDDSYHLGAVGNAVSNLVRSNCDIVIGALEFVEIADGKIKLLRTESPNYGKSVHVAPIFENNRVEQFQFLQPSMFWHRRYWKIVGGVNEVNHFNMDREWCLRALAAGATVCTTDQVLATFSIHSGSKTEEQGLQFVKESAHMYWRLAHSPGFLKLPCFLESLRYYTRYMQNKIYSKSQALERKGHPLLSKTYWGISGLLRHCRLFLQRLILFQRKKVLAVSATEGIKLDE